MRDSDEGSAIGSLVSSIACNQYWMYSIWAELNISLFSPLGRVPKRSFFFRKPASERTV